MPEMAAIRWGDDPRSSLSTPRSDVAGLMDARALEVADKLLRIGVHGIVNNDTDIITVGIDLADARHAPRAISKTVERNRNQPRQLLLAHRGAAIPGVTSTSPSVPM